MLKLALEPNIFLIYYTRIIYNLHNEKLINLFHKYYIANWDGVRYNLKMYECNKK